MTLILRTIFLAILTTPLLGQSRLTAELASEKIQTSFYSDSTEFHFGIKSIDSLTFHRFILHADSIDHYPYDAIFGKDKRKKAGKFMADNNEPWRAGDFITAENEKLPQRKFLFGWTKGNETVIFYWHGGIGKHLHVVLINSTTRTFTAFVTLANSDVIHKLDWDHKLQEIRLQKLQRFVNADQVRYLENRLVRKDEEVF
jgi:hypothetical protein